MAKVIQIVEDTVHNAIREVYVGGLSLQITVFPRYDLNKFVKKIYSQSVGVYILYNEVTGNTGMAYVGETENIAERLQQHDKAMSKLFWTHVIVLQDRCDTLNKAYCKYMEYMLYTYLVNAGRVVVSNSVVPTKSMLSVTDKIIADNILTNFREVCIALNIRMLESVGIGAFEENTDVYYMQYKGTVAMLRKITSTSMFLLKNSVCYYNTQTPAGYEHLVALRDKLLKAKKAKMIEDTCYFMLLEDVEFDSETEAASFVAMCEFDVPVESLWLSRH